MEETNKFNPKGCIVLILFMAGIIGMMMTANSRPELTIAILGMMFLGFGTVVIIESRKNGEFQFLMLMIVVLGAGMTIGGFAFAFGGEIVRNLFMDNASLIIALILSFVGVMLILDHMIRKNDQKKCTVNVIGTCIQIDSRISSGKSKRTNRRTYCPIYQYIYNGYRYTVSSRVYTGMNTIKVRMGEEYSMYINPDNPQVFSEENENKRIGMGVSIIGLVLFAIGWAIFILDKML